MTNPHPEWLQRFHAELDEALLFLAARLSSHSSLIRDAVVRGRKIRSVTALQMLEWAGWKIRDDPNRGFLIEDLALLEMMHAAACIFDDLIDSDTNRRGVATFERRNGKPQAVLTALLLLTTAFSSSRKPEVTAELLRAMRDMVIGESWDAFMMQTDEPLPSDLAEIYLQKSTASFGAACAIAAIHAGCSASNREKARGFGIAMGALYQSTNDYWDTFGIAVQARGELDDIVLVSLSVPLCLAVTEDPSRRGEIGGSMTRRELGDFYETLRQQGFDAKTREFIEKVKDRIRRSFPGTKIPQKLENIMAMIDSREFWAYKYAT